MSTAQEALSAPWTLSTSQTPHSQTDKVDLQKHPGFICGGGGFGPAAQDGYGVSYIITGEDMLFFHVTAHKSSSLTVRYSAYKHYSFTILLVNPKISPEARFIIPFN